MKKKYLIIAGLVVTVLAIVIVSCVLYKKNYYKYNDTEINKTYTENNSNNNENNSINGIDMEVLSKYLIGRNDRDTVLIEYLKDTNNVSLTFSNIDNRQYEVLFITQNKEDSSLFLRDANLDSSVGEEDSLGIIPINEDDTYGSVCTKIFEYIDTYESVIINNLGDNVNYGEDVGVTIDENGNYRLDINS